MVTIEKVAVYCSSTYGNSEKWRKIAEEFADCLVEEKFDMVFGGSSSGLMGVVSDRLMQKGREVIGVIPKNWTAEVKSVGISTLIETDDMALRKKKMIELSDAFIALPGGLGTWDEIIEVSVLAKLGYLSKPVGLLNAFGYYEPLKQMLENAFEAGFLYREDCPMIFRDNPSDLIKSLKEWTPNTEKREADVM